MQGSEIKDDFKSRRGGAFVHVSILYQGLTTGLAQDFDLRLIERVSPDMACIEHDRIYACFPQIQDHVRPKAELLAYITSCREEKGFCFLGFGFNVFRPV